MKVSGKYRHHVGSYNRVYKFNSMTRKFSVPRGQSIWWNGTEHYKVPFTVCRCGTSERDWVTYKKGVAHGDWSTKDPGDPTDMQLTRCKHSSMQDAFSKYVRRLCVK